MFKPLLSRDFSNINQYFPFFASGALLFLLLSRLTDSATTPALAVFSNICFNLTLSCVIGFFVNVQARILIRFVNNFYKDESYLTHTLPVTRSALWNAKTLSLLLSLVLTFSFSGLILCLLLPHLWETIKTLVSSAPAIIILPFLLLLELTLAHLGLFSAVLLARSPFTPSYTHPSHLSRLRLALSSHPAIKTALCFAPLYLLPQFLLLALIFLLSRLNPDFSFIFTTSSAPASPELTSLFVTHPATRTLLYLALAFYTLFSLLYYSLGKKLFSRGVDVE